MSKTKEELETHLESLRKCRDYQKREEERDLAFGFLPRVLAIPLYIVAVLWFLVVGIAAQANIFSESAVLVISEFKLLWWSLDGVLRLATVVSTVCLMSIGLETIDQNRRLRRKNNHRLNREHFDKAILEIEGKLERWNIKSG